MSIPSRPLVTSEYGHARTFFASARTWEGRSIFQTERMANLLIDVLRSQMRARRFVVHDFVVMPDHVHILLTVYDDMTLEKAMQLVKGGFSYRAGKELDFRGEVWQRGFSDVLVIGEESFHRHREYIDLNPVKAGLAVSPDGYPYGTAYLKKMKSAGAKAQ